MRITRGKLFVMVLIVAAISLLFFIVWELEWIGFFGAGEIARDQEMWRLQGESFDPSQFVPKAVPADQNFGALPIFKTSINPVDGRRGLNELNEALKPLGILSSPIKLETSQKDFKRLNAQLIQAYVKKFGSGALPPPPMEIVERLFPEWAMLREESLKRLECTFDFDCTPKPLSRVMDNSSPDILNLGAAGEAHALSALVEGKGTDAFDDLGVLFKIRKGTAKAPTLIPGLVDMAWRSYILKVILKGLSDHVWTASQLEEIQGELENEPPLKTGRFCLKGELILSEIPSYQTFKKDPDNDSPFGHFGRWWPSEWFDANQIKSTDTLLLLARSIDPKRHTVDPSVSNKFREQYREQAKSVLGLAPWNIIDGLTVAAITTQPMTFAHEQSLTDEAYIACGLERFHLANTAYPKGLAEIESSFAKALPHDVIGGQSYHYDLRPDGSYLLYSIGWNEKDDGGTYDPHHMDTGDWVWPGRGD